MMMKKLAIATAIAMMGVGAAQAQVSTPTESTTADNSTGLMTELSNSLTNVFNAGRTSTIVAAMAGTPAGYTLALPADFEAEGVYEGWTRYALIDGAYVVSPTGLYARTTAPVAGVAQTTTFNLANPVDITALAGAVNLSTINGSIDISGTNVSITGIAGTVEANAAAATSSTALAINGNNFSTTVIGAMNSSTLDVMAKTVDLSEMTKSVLDIAVLANQGAAPSITTQSFGEGSLGLATVGSTILEAATETTQFNMEGLVSGTDTLASSMTEELQSMNVFNMALNMAPIVAGVKIAAEVDPNAWFLNAQTGVVALSSMQIATTAIGAMNSSITHLGKNLTTLAK
jgi:hypothetical protein